MKNIEMSLKGHCSLIIEMEGLFEGEGGGRLFNLTKTMVSVLQKDLEYKVEKLKYKKLDVIQPRIKNKSELSVGEKTIPGQSTWSFTVVID